jgi:radical SAM protein with 4Fe4S-binding SPASM domain
MPCDDLGYQQYFAEVVAKMGTERAPLNALIELTERCNLRCQHCYIHDPAQDHLVRSKELTTEQWFRIFDELAEAGCLWMTWTGGEILLRPDFPDLYRYAKSKGFLIVLFTNGTMITSELVELFREWYPHYVEITLYGMTADTYERVTGVRGAYERCIHGIDALIEAQIPLRLKAVAMTLNKPELQAMYDYSTGLGVDFRHDSVLRPTFHGQDIRHLRLLPEDVVELDRIRPEVQVGFRAALQRSPQARENNVLYDPNGLYNCGAGFRSFHIDPYGLLTLCHMIRAPGYDLTSGSFAEGWEVFLGEMRSTRITKDVACLHCELQGLCTQCPAFADLENGDPESVVDYACALTHLRAERLGFSSQS